MSQGSVAEAWYAAAAARAAEDRVLVCRRRLQELRNRRPIERADVERARDHLTLARERFAAADARRRRRAIYAAETAVALGGSTTAAPGVELRFVERLREHGADLSALFDSYFALGGACGLIEVDAYVHGLIDLPPRERNIVQHALWELIELAED